MPRYGNYAKAQQQVLSLLSLMYHGKVMPSNSKNPPPPPIKYSTLTLKITSKNYYLSFYLDLYQRSPFR
jgi:hypothetical protein